MLVKFRRFPRAFDMPLRFLLILGLALVMAMRAHAQMTIEIVGGATNRVPLAILPFTGAPLGVLDPAAVVAANLGRSGHFNLIGDRGEVSPPDPGQVSLATWKGRGADAVLSGQLRTLADGRLEVRFWLLDTLRQQPLLALAYTTTPGGLRAVAHRISDAVHEKLLGEPGSYSGRIAYILKRGGRYELQVADADSENPLTILASPEPIISPAWSPDGKRLAYVSFEDRKPVVYVQNLADGSRRAVSRFRGSNSAPAWSPDGRKLAVTLSRDATAQIYLLDLETGETVRFTRGGSIDTEARFSPDGRWLYFTSDRGGTPQIYRAPVDGGEASRVTFEGSYNVSPALSPDGSRMAFVHRRDGRFHIAVMDLATRQMRVLTDTAADESPSFAPNGRMILYATLINGRGVLATVSIDGRIRQRLSQSGDLREPAWAP
jgi:TolB protein